MWHGILKRGSLQIFFYFNSAEKDVQKGKKTARKTTRAGGSGVDVQKIAQEQQAKLEKEKDERMEQIKAAKEAAATAPPPESPPAPAKVQAVAKPKAPKDPETSKNANHKIN